MNKNGFKNGTLYLVRVAMFAALLTALKFAISFIPNVEVITLIIVVVSAAFGIIYSLPATLIFCTVEIALYGFSSWVILYYLYWPLLAVVSSVLLKNKNTIVAVVISILGSILFGVLSACADTLFCVGVIPSEELSKYWVAYYLRGLYFDLIHVISNAAIVLVLFRPLIEICKKIAPNEYLSSNYGIRKILKYQLEYMQDDVF